MSWLVSRKSGRIFRESIPLLTFFILDREFLFLLFSLDPSLNPTINSKYILYLKLNPWWPRLAWIYTTESRFYPGPIIILTQRKKRQKTISVRFIKILTLIRLRSGVPLNHWGPWVSTLIADQQRDAPEKATKVQTNLTQWLRGVLKSTITPWVFCWIVSDWRALIGPFRKS
jgi:hypothetical protein